MTKKEKDKLDDIIYRLGFIENAKDGEGDFWQSDKLGALIEELMELAENG